MANGELAQSGLLSSIIRCRGDLQSFRALASKSGVKVGDVIAGVPFAI